ncbi:hypothetical protein [Raoultella terrigena]|uniref:hypothetical protein n=1 Tax=Raoultella terrigena TaxID=577 RepID=UPI0030DF6304
MIQAFVVLATPSYSFHIFQLLADMMLQNSRHACPGQANHQRTVDRFQRAEKLPPGAHHDIAIA